jgi:hypothetical protein
MPVKEVRNMSGNIMGYKWGETGKVYRTREQAEKQGKAIYAQGYGNNKSTTTRK